MLNHQQCDELWDHIKAIPVAMMATLDEGRIRARPMHLVQKEFVGKLWFFTDINAAKTGEINGSHEVGLSFEDTHKQLYISVSGTAQIVRDKRLIEEFWNPMVGAWFPKGKEDPDIGLVEVAVTQAELWDAKHNRATQLVKLVSANMRNERPDLGEHHQYGQH